jgi:uncharacterized protein YecT (DUF1311 family)
MIRAMLLAVCTAGLFSLPALAQSKPKGAMPAASFDCAKAKTAAEKAICADPETRRLDAQVAASFARARSLYTADPAAAAALMQMQRRFNTRREALVGTPHPDALPMPLYLGAQAVLLDNLDRQRAGFVGDWTNDIGVVSVRAGRTATASLTVEITSAEPTRGAWVCQVDGAGTPVNGRLTLRTAQPGLGGWTISLSRRGGVLVVEETSPRGRADAMRPYCGLNGGLNGEYLPAKPPEH